MTLTTVMFYSCNTENEDDVVGNRTSVHFTSEIGGEVQKRVTGTNWSPNDQIGVFMKRAGSALSSSSIIDGADNKVYATSGNGYFTPINDGQAIYYPESGTVDFISYYPHQANLVDYKYKIDITDQSSQEDLDLLYSNNLTGISNNNRIPLAYTRQMAKIELNITTGAGVTSLDGLSIVISGLKTKADFNLANAVITVDDASGADISPNIMTITQTSAKGQTVVIPDNGGAGRTISFTLPSIGTFKWEIPSSLKLEKGKRYKYDVVLKNGSVTPSYGWMETPIIGSIENTMYVSHMLPDRDGRNYSMLYDTKYKLAYWVAYPLHTSHIGSGRHERWTYDPKISNAFQPDLSKSYKESTLDRGHQIPNGDRNYSVAGSESTFYFSNMTAQYNRLNQGVWVALENQIRTWTGTCDTMYVVTGAMLTTSSDLSIEYAHDASNQQVGKPKYYYKALAQRIGSTYYTAAFKMNNEQPSSSDINTYRLTVKDLETATGFTFFPGIPDEDKSKIVASRWN